MNAQSKTSLFAFKVAQQQKAAKADTQWKMRDGVAVAGCTGAAFRSQPFHKPADSGVIC